MAPMILPFLFGMLVTLFSAGQSAGADAVPTPTGREPAAALWAGIRLPVPESVALRDYLGLPPGGSFTVGQVRAEAVIVQVYSMYCPHCQREAPQVNALYDLIQQDAEWNRRLKMIGVGIGNSAYEVDFYRDTYKVAFPLFPDDRFTIHRKLGETRTPRFFVLLPVGEGAVRVLADISGGFGDPRDFLDSIRSRLARVHREAP
jgi:thiol-disulfide isomerase/thioredoxin